ncbi:hypothetical protein V1512DRAFT_240662 [Lipomyces arxii]|uniref:uncharacterized protein n=1 Tax=Lipomyces arxii TaxID=56418 RepID=UPI0034CFB42B
MNLGMGNSDRLASGALHADSGSNSANGMTPQRKRLYKNFLVATTATYLSVMITKRATLARRHIPTMFSHNGTTPPFNKYQDGVQAVGLGTLLSCSVFSMGVTATTLIFNINNVQEFHEKMRRFMQSTGLRPSNSEELEKNVDPKILELETAIEEFMAGTFPQSDEQGKSEKK